MLDYADQVALFSDCHHEGDPSMKRFMNMLRSTVPSSESSLPVHCQSYETIRATRPVVVQWWSIFSKFLLLCGEESCPASEITFLVLYTTPGSIILNVSVSTPAQGAPGPVRHVDTPEA